MMKEEIQTYTYSSISSLSSSMSFSTYNDVYKNSPKSVYQKFKRGDLIEVPVGDLYVCIFPEQKIFVRVLPDELEDLCSEKLLSRFIQSIYVTQEVSDFGIFKEGSHTQKTKIDNTDIFPEFNDIMEDWAIWLFNLSPEKIPKNSLEIAETLQRFLNENSRLKIQGALGVYFEKSQWECYLDQLSTAC